LLKKPPNKPAFFSILFPFLSAVVGNFLFDLLVILTVTGCSNNLLTSNAFDSLGFNNKAFLT